MPAADPTQSAFLELAGISKRYAGVRALEGVDFACERGKIHAVLGENGAGKSTLIKIIAGVVQPDSGRMRLAGSEVSFATPSAANAAGVVCIFQELSLMPDLSVADNISIASPPRRFGLIDAKAQRRRAEELLSEIGCEDVNPLRRVRDLPLSRRQVVEIAKALGKRPQLLILDEATSALTSADVEKVYAMLARLKAEGVAILYISHRMHEVEALADRASVFRNGRHIETFDKGRRSTADIIQLMIGRDIAAQYPPKPARNAAKPVLALENLCWERQLDRISLSIGAGEIVGLGGLDGQGQKSLLLALFGVLRGVTGRLTVADREVRPGSPAAAKSVGIALVPEDRKTEGLMLPMSIADNLAIASLDALSTGPFIDTGKERTAIQRAIARLQIKLDAASDAVSTLSGGNQQKVVLAKWLMTDPRIILLNDPTRGIDVGTKQELYRLMRELADQGAAILFYSTDYDELIGCCDRVVIMYDGRIVRELEGDDLTETNIVASSLNVDTDTAAGAAHA
ncbi:MULTISPECIES: sugar ABC transporter ATP-binding protein [unclassified Bradyrhizobium]|jgi:ribose transport system ATP-binding protein|uniref:sugar ABC transporter ATP-binding protein n=1 Tax=unclassified Bradyrhizobium TaxID=2631580 RepID=UPI001FFBCBA9|nr:MULTISPECIES: sugar ABC transporter ATP-binding protein [unclassified Bradyrhizobium]MCK1533733.1 sugar ABC transporter ATP-binding protein [Bradyrhizobium sp. 176]MCK1556121.1 sugar ABC transporter ATP-binding protein [Bradyrhizobium sp. 171]